MRYMKQFAVILAVTCLGDFLNYILPLPIPGSIYGLVIMLTLLVTGVIKIYHVKATAEFLIDIMPMMFIPAAVGLGLPVKDTGTALDLADARHESLKKAFGLGLILRRLHAHFAHDGALIISLTFGVVISIIGYFLGMLIKKKTRLSVMNPLLISIIFVMIMLELFGVDYKNYNVSAKYLSYLLTPATVSLAIPLYLQLERLKKNWLAITVGLVSGAISSMATVLLLSILFRLPHEDYVTLLPKSITTAIGMGVSEELGGIVTITVAVIIVTGILGNVLADTVCKLFRITDPVAKGLAIGACSHAIGTARAMAMGEIEGAMSSLAIVVSGLLTVIGASFFAMLY